MENVVFAEQYMWDQPLYEHFIEIDTYEFLLQNPDTFFFDKKRLLFLKVMNW